MDTQLLDELVAEERAAWQALSTPGGAGAYYAEHLADRVLMIFGGGMVIDDRAAALASMDGEPWSSYDIDETRVLPLGSDAAVLAYRVRATRGEHVYEAILNSTYVRAKGGWRMAVHQQSPV